MSDPFIGEIKMISWNYPPRYWAFCDGSTLAISTNQALFALLGTTYGGNGTTSFMLPDLRSRTPIGAGSPAGGGSPIQPGQVGGEASHTLSIAETPLHTHPMFGTAAPGTNEQPNNNEYLGSIASGFLAYPNDGSVTSLAASSVSNAGGGHAHENRQPYLVINYIIALSGIFPSRN